MVLSDDVDKGGTIREREREKWREGRGEKKRKPSIPFRQTQVTGTEGGN